MAQQTDWKLVHRMQIAVRWGDMDALGHVNNTVYFRFMEQGRIDWLHSLNCVPDQDGNGAVIVNAHCEFLAPLKYPDQVELQTFIGQPGRSSFETRQEMRSLANGGRLFAAGGAKVVWVDGVSGKSVALPPVLRALFGQSA